MWNYSKETGMLNKTYVKNLQLNKIITETKNPLAGLDRRLDTAEDRSMEITQIGAKGNRTPPPKTLREYLRPVREILNSPYIYM